MIASSFGFTIFVLVFLIAPISGGHINPAITLGLALARRITLLRGVLYVAAQCGGAILGALLSKSMSSEEWVRVGGGVLGSHHFGWGPQLGAEFIATALLVLTVFAAVEPGRALAPRYSSVLAPFAIGMAVRRLPQPPPRRRCGLTAARVSGICGASGTYSDHWHRHQPCARSGLGGRGARATHAPTRETAAAPGRAALLLTACGARLRDACSAVRVLQALDLLGGPNGRRSICGCVLVCYVACHPVCAAAAADTSAAQGAGAEAVL